MGGCNACTSCTDIDIVQQHNIRARWDYNRGTSHTATHTATLEATATGGASASASSIVSGPRLDRPSSSYYSFNSNKSAKLSPLPSINDPNSFQALILDQDEFYIKLSDFIAKMNVTAKRHLWDHRVVLKQSDGTKEIQNEISNETKQMIHFLIDWCLVYTKV